MSGAVGLERGVAEGTGFRRTRGNKLADAFVSFYIPQCQSSGKICITQ